MRRSLTPLILLALASSLLLAACCGGGGDDSGAGGAPPEGRAAEGGDEENIPDDSQEVDDKEADDGDSDGEVTSIKSDAVKIKGDLKVASNRYRTLLNSGRKKVRGGDIQGGIADFVEALKDDPNDPKLLGELSYAAIQAGDYDRAISAAQLCTRQRQEPRNEGACWYNLGLAWEKKGDNEKAAQAYQQSLAVRPSSKPVEDRLAALGGGSPPPAPGSSPACGGFGCPPAPSLNALCERLRGALSEQNGQEEEGSECSSVASRKVNSGGLETVAILDVRVGNIGEEYYVLAMKDAEGWRPAGTLAYVYNPGAFGIYEEATINISLRDVLPGEPVEVIADVRLNRHDTDMGIAEYEDLLVHNWVICSYEDGTPTCLPAIPRAYDYTRERDEEMADADTPPSEGLPIHIAWGFDASFPSPGKIKLTLKDVKGDVPADIRVFNGEHDLRSLPGSSFGAMTR